MNMQNYYSKEEIQSIYMKVAKVVSGCTTMAQLYSAHKYCKLFLQKVHPLHKKIAIRNINSLIENQRIKVRLNGTKLKKDKKAI